MLKFFRNFFRYLKYKKMIRTNSSFILDGFANIVNDTMSHLEKDERIKSPLHKEVLKFESTALVFWLFRGSGIFPEPLHKLTLDELHNQYYEELRKRGYDFKLRQKVNDDFVLRYKTYDKFMTSADDFVKVGTNFASFVSEKAKTDLDTREMMIAGELMGRATVKFEEFRNVVQQ